MKMEKIAEKLKLCYLNIDTSLPKSCVDILRVRKYDPGRHTAFSPDTLYLAYASEFPVLYQPDINLNFLFINEQNESGCYDCVNYIEVCGAVSLYSIMEEIMEMLYREQRASENIGCLTKAVFRRADMQHMINLLAEILKRPVILDNPMGMIIFQSGDSFSTDAMRKNHDNYHAYYEKYRSERYIERVHKDKEPVYICGEDNCPFLITGIRLMDDSFVYLVIYECERRFAEEDIELIIFFKNIVPMIEKNSPFPTYVKPVHEDILANLLAGNVYNSGVEDEKAAVLDQKLMKYRRMLIIQTAREDKDNIIIPFIQNRLQNMMKNSQVSFFEGCIICFLSYADEERFLTENLQEMICFLSQNHLLGGMSRRFQELKYLRKYFGQAINGVKLGLLYGIEKTIYFYEDYAYFHMLQVCASQTEVKNFIHPSILCLWEFDEKNHTNYIRTLNVYLSNGKNKMKTAKLLGVNRKTVLERICKIKDGFGLDVEKEAVFNLLHSCRMMEFLRFNGGMG